MARFFLKVLFFYFREYKLNLSGFHDILTNILFFFISIFIFIFSFGPEKETLSILGIGILWTLLLLSSTLSLRKFYQEDFDNGNLILMHLNGFSYELISILKTISHFIFVQIPFLISIPIASLLLDITYDKLVLLLISFLIGSLILSCLGSISASMNLLNNRNYLLGSVIVIIFSVPAVIFSVGLINSNENYDSLINILFGILLIVFAINPWASGACLKLALQNN
jgi:heme exporter protein B|tara:strand:- start:1067 stop:1741 length:675 start_codon:yes stop_codon:yes gene_type:complete